MESSVNSTTSSSKPKNIDQFSQEFGVKTGQMAHNLSNTASHYVQSGRDYVQENPVRSIGVAAAVGLVAGSLMTMVARRRDH